MKFTLVSAMAAGAAAFVIPDVSMLTELLHDDGNHRHVALSDAAEGVEQAAANLDEWVRAGVARAGMLFAGDREVSDELEYAANEAAAGAVEDGLFLPLKKEVIAANQTVYQLLQASNLTTKFAALVDQFPALVARLNDTTVNSTVFLPVDAAFDALPGGQLNATGELLEQIVSYHVGAEAYPFARMFATHTIPSLVNEPLLGDGVPQRLRVRFEKHLGLGVNFGSHVVAPNFVAANGVIHALDALLMPPVFVGRALSLAPAEFSTLLLAMEKTDFVSEIHSVPLVGATVLAPSNKAFVNLGPKLNAFLFNSPVGLKYLRALLRYSIAPNATVYSDAYYGPAADTVASTVDGDGLVTRSQYKLPTLLGNAIVTVNVTSVPGFVFMAVNHKVPVTVQDGIAKNGVIQEVGRVVFPPNVTATPGYPWQDYKDVTTVAEAIARLAPYMDDADPSDGDAVDGSDEL